MADDSVPAVSIGHFEGKPEGDWMGIPTISPSSIYLYTQSTQANSLWMLVIKNLKQFSTSSPHIMRTFTIRQSISALNKAGPILRRVGLFEVRSSAGASVLSWLQ